MSTKATELRTPGNKASKGAGVSLADDIAIKPGAAPHAREAGWRACVAQADARAAALAQVIAEIRARGITTPYAIAAALTARGIPTARGHKAFRPAGAQPAEPSGSVGGRRRRGDMHRAAPTLAAR